MFNLLAGAEGHDDKRMAVDSNELGPNEWAEIDADKDAGLEEYGDM